MLKCGDGALYTGITTDMKRRLKQHAAGKASKYTRAKLPVRLVYSEGRHNESSAKKREAALKALSRAEKLAFLTSPRSAF